MKKSEICFAVITDRKEVVKVGRSVVVHPPVRYTGKGIRWLDDATLLKNR